MNMQFRLWLLLSLPVFFADGLPLAHGQSASPPRSTGSHREVPGGFDPANVQQMMTDRLKDLRELHQLQDKVQELLKDPEFISGIQKIPEEQLRQMREHLLKGEGLSQNPNWQRLLEQAAQRNKLNEQYLKMFQRWAERAERKQPSTESGQPIPDKPAEAAPAPSSAPPSGSAPPPPHPTPSEPGPALLDRLQEKSTKWLMENIDNVSGDMLQTLTEMGGKEASAPLADLLRSVPPSDLFGVNIRENPLVSGLRTESFSRYLSNASDFVQRQNGVWDKLGSLFNKSSLPSMPPIVRPSISMRPPSATGGDGWLPALLSLLMLGAIVLLICKRGFGSKAPAGAEAEWRLGSWPVPPGAVSTRQDLIRAFEYLALLSFGAAAAAYHHHQLADRLAESPHSGGAARRQAAEMLAWLYEQARYAPAGETLSQEQLSDARHALCLLAGVTTA